MQKLLLVVWWRIIANFKGIVLGPSMFSNQKLGT